MGSLIIIAAMFALLWLLLIRPQRRAQVERQRLVESVDVGDEILSSGGVYGVIRGVGEDEDDLYVEIAPGVEVRMDRRAVGAVVKKDESEDAADDEPDGEEAVAKAEPEAAAEPVAADGGEASAGQERRYPS